MTHADSLDALNDRALLSQFGDLLRHDREGNASLLRHIDAIDRRQLWAKLGYPSLFALLVTGYHMSESTAGKRIGAARAARRFPVLFTMVAAGDIHLSGIHRLKAHLSSENHEHVLAIAKHKTTRQIEAIVAHLAPRPDVPSSLRALPNRTASPVPATPAAPAASAPPSAPSAAPPSAAPPSASTPSDPAPTASAPKTTKAPSRSPDPTPLSPGRYRLQLTIDEKVRDKLEQLKDLLAHQIPNGDVAVILERALDALLMQVHKQKTGATEKPRARKPATSGTARWVRTVPLAVRREVWRRDEGRCAFVGEDGHRCNETRCLEFAHVEPWAKGGETTVENISLRCRAHNAFEADRDYGAGFMAHKRKLKPKPLQVREPTTRYTLGTPAFSKALSLSSRIRPLVRDGFELTDPSRAPTATRHPPTDVGRRRNHERCKRPFARCSVFKNCV